MGERSSICCVGARSTLHEQQTHQKLGRAVYPPVYVSLSAYYGVQDMSLEIGIRPDERGLKVPCSATELPAQPGWSLPNLAGSWDVDALPFGIAGTLGSPGEVEGSGERYYESRQDPELEHQIQELLCADGLLRLCRHQQDAPDDGYQPDQEERLGDDLPLPDNDANGVQQLDEDEDQEHPVEDRERRIYKRLLERLRADRLHRADSCRGEDHADGEHQSQRRTVVDDPLRPAQHLDKPRLSLQ